LIAAAIWKLVLAPRMLGEPSRATPTPPVVLAMMGGGTFDLAKARGKVVFLDFWASWCEPCKLSIPLVQHYEAAHHDVEVVSIDAGEPVPLAERFAAERKMRRVAFDPQMRASDAFGVDVFPTMIVVDPHGKQRAKWVGFNPLIESAMDHARKTLAR